jgi:hypothetical protein
MTFVPSSRVFKVPTVLTKTTIMTVPQVHLSALKCLKLKT